jgi:hypothetical protein
MKVCELCKKEFNTKSAKARFCGKFCKNKAWRDENKEYKARKLTEWRNNNPEKAKANYVNRDKEKEALAKAAYYIANKFRINKLGVERATKRYHSDLNFKLRKILRCRLLNALKDETKGGSAIDGLGCSIEELRDYLESKFKPGMTWENHGLNGWHIDHIQPLVNFDLTNPEQVTIACRYTNLQPLWAKDNLIKADK